MNKHNVIYLEMSEFVSIAREKKLSLSDIPAMVESAVREDLAACEMLKNEEEDVNAALIRIAGQTEGGKFVFVIDEWDCVIREAKNDTNAQRTYLEFLRGWFKTGTFTPKVVAAAYMTGILPVKKDGSHSPVADFNEHSILHPGKYAPCFGFSEEEVKGICEKHGMDFDAVKHRYDGYTIGSSRSVYNPYSVMKAAMESEEEERYRSFWVQTSASEALLSYIDIDMDSLQETTAGLSVGQRTQVNTKRFQNDMETFSGKDDVLTLLIHLGYLSYDQLPRGSRQSEVVNARIPNEEVRQEFEGILRQAKHKRLVELVRKSDQLLKDVLAGNEAAVANAIHSVHDSHYAPMFYNDEQSLRSVVRLACITWMDQYCKVEELPSGHGVADVVFIPRRESPLPGIVMELKWEKSEEGAIAQIKSRNYQKALEDLVGDVILVGINYDSDDKIHTCRIERVRR